MKVIMNKPKWSKRKSRLPVLPLFFILCILLVGSDGRLAASTTNPSIGFQKYNIFVDTSIEGTQEALRAQGERMDSDSTSTAPSLQDQRDFQ